MPGWTQANLADTSKSDPNAIGGVVMKFSAHLTEAKWFVFNGETERLTPFLVFISCANMIPTQVAPNVNLRTNKSLAYTIPIAPIMRLRRSRRTSPFIALLRAQQYIK
jgi:hypothetical protein